MKRRDELRDFFTRENFQKWRKKYRKIARIITILVVFGTTYALILPALTLDQQKAEQTSGIDVPNPSLVDMTTVDPMTTQATQSDSETPSSSPPEVKTNDGDATTSFSSTSEGKPADTEAGTSEEKTLITRPTEMNHEESNYILTARFDGQAQLPQGVELRVTELVASSDIYQQHLEKTKEVLGTNKLRHARFLDISFLYQGQEVEPAAPVTITIKNKDAVKLSQDSKMKVVHFESDSQVEVVQAETKETNQVVAEVRFEAQSFSVYGDVAVDYYTVDFVYTDTNGVEQTLSTLIDKTAGSTISTLPEVPFKNGFVFSHWIDKATGQKVDAKTVVSSNMVIEAVFNPITIYNIDVTYYYHNVSKNQDITIDKETVQIEPDDTPYQITPPASTEISAEEDTSLPADAFYYPEKPILEFTAANLEALDKADGVDDNKITQKVKYVPNNAEYDFVYLLKNLSGDGYSEIQTVRVRGVLGSTVTPQTLSFNYADFEKADSVKITKASGQKINVYYTRKDFTLYYNSNGGSYVAPRTDQYKTSVPLTSVVPEREGYTFAGWYDSSDLSGTRVTGNVTLDKDKTLYAKWTPKTVPYTIAYYKEVYDNATNTTKYVYDSSQNATGQVGTVVQAAAAPNIKTSLPNHEKDATRNASSKITVAPDGSSVLNVYYKLKRYTFIFNLDNPYATLYHEGRSYTGSQYRISDVVLGQDISNQWPTSGDIVNTNARQVGRFYAWYDTQGRINYVTKRYEVTTDMLTGMNAENQKTFPAQWQRSVVPFEVEYWLQSPDNPAVYDLSYTYSQEINLTNPNLSAKSLAGFTNISTIPRGYRGTELTWAGGVYRFYYDRDRYKIDYYNGSPQATTKDRILFDANINNATYNYVPPRPSGVDADYTWGGWHTDSLLTQPYSFNKMPSNNLALYAKWIAPTFKIRFDTNGGTTATPAEQTIEKYKKATYPGDAGRANYEFLGWFTAPTGGELYDWAKPVTQDTTLYAQWRLKPLTYRVEYLEAGTTNKLASDKVVTSPALQLNQLITEKALGITGYRPNVTSQDIRLNFDGNVLRFYYEPKAKTVTYTIKYVLDANEAIEVAPTKTLTVDGSIIRAKEEAVAVDKNHMKKQPGVTAEMLAKDYYPKENTQSLVLTSNTANNTIIFRYLNYDTKVITVNYLDMDGKPIAGQAPLTTYQKKSGTYVVAHKAIAGYTYDHSTDSEKNSDKVVYRITDGGHLNIDLYYKKNLTIAAQDKEKVYDARALVSSGVNDVKATYQSDLVTGDRLDKIAYDVSQANVGTSTTKPKSAKIIDAKGKDRNYFYKLTYEPGTLTVTPQSVVVKVAGETHEKVYDGKQQTVGYKVDIEDTSGLYQVSDIRFNGTDAEKKVTEKDAGTYDLHLQGKFVNTNPNFEVTFLVADGQLVIRPRVLTIISNTASKPFDGEELKDDGFTIKVPDGVTYKGFVDGEGVELDFVGSQLMPGRTANSFAYEAKSGTNLTNYDITVEFGELKVLQTINIQKTSEDWTPLVGGKFEITKWDGLNWSDIPNASEITNTSEEGVRVPVGLEPGRYRIRETAAPDGFIVLDRFIYFKIEEGNFNEDGSTSTYNFQLTDENGNMATPDKARQIPLPEDADYSTRLQIANEQGRALPNTGGEGQQFFVISGLILIGLAYPLHRFIQGRRERGIED